MTFFELKIVKCIVSLVSHNSESLIQVKSHRNAPIPKPISIVVWFLPLTLNFNLGPLGNIVTKNKAMLSMFWLLNCLTCTVEKKKTFLHPSLSFTFLHLQVLGLQCKFKYKITLSFSLSSIINERGTIFFCKFRDQNSSWNFS